MCWGCSKAQCMINYTAPGRPADAAGGEATAGVPRRQAQGRWPAGQGMGCGCRGLASWRGAFEQATRQVQQYTGRHAAMANQLTAPMWRYSSVCGAGAWKWRGLCIS